MTKIIYAKQNQGTVAEMLAFFSAKEAVQPLVFEPGKTSTKDVLQATVVLCHGQISLYVLLKGVMPKNHDHPWEVVQVMYKKPYDYWGKTIQRLDPEAYEHMAAEGPEAVEEYEKEYDADPIVHHKREMSWWAYSDKLTKKEGRLGWSFDMPHTIEGYHFYDWWPIARPYFKGEI